MAEEYYVFEKGWAQVLANPFYAFTSNFSGKTRLVTNLAFLSKRLLVDIGGVLWREPATLFCL
jgi:hypothetical protein